MTFMNKIRVGNAPTRILFLKNEIKYVWGDTVGSCLKLNSAENSRNIRVGKYDGVVFEN